MSPDTVTVYAVGDIIPDRQNPEFLFEPALPTLKQADILFGQLEASLSNKGEPQLQNYPGTRVSPEKVSGLTYAGFNVISFASNHHLDLGEQAFFETINTLTKNKINVIGVGRNINEARKPLILERKGVRVAFLAYCSVLPKGYEARADKSGCAPVRASTFYEQVDWQPGTPPKILTLANKDDVEAMVSDITNARRLADVVIMSIHWGVHYVPAVIATYQKEVGHIAIDAGVDLILGHHAHILKGIEVYKGKVIFYSLCNFAVAFHAKSSLGESFYNVKVDPEYPDYPFPFDSRKSIIAKCLISDKKIAKVSFLPLYINRNSQPEILSRQDKRFDEVVNYMEGITESQGLNGRYQIDGDEVMVLG